MMEGKERGDKKKKKQESMVKKSTGGILVGKRGGPSTPSPKWRFHFTSPKQNQPNTNTSARKLCASLWEIQPQHHHSFTKMTNHARRPHIPKYEVKPPITQPDQLRTPSSSRSHVAAMMQRHRLVGGNGHALQPLSPASNGSSMEIAPYNPAVSPTCSSDNNGRKESRYGRKTSTELLKVLNRIWSLEEQNASNMSLLKPQKMELDHSRIQIHKLLKEKQTNRKEINDLVKQVTVDKVLRKNEEQDRIKAAIQSMTRELVEEKKLRKHSESLHWKLARELSEIKSSLSNTLKELERERKARILLENLCDKFARSIRDYEYELRSIKDKAGIDGVDSHDQLILRISEAWLDERMQRKLAEAENNVGEDDTVVDKLTVDIETFLHDKRSVKSRTIGNLSTNEVIKCSSRRESFPFNQEASAPQHAADEDDSTDSDLRHLERRMCTIRKQHKNHSRHCGNDAPEGHSEEVVKSKSKRKMVKGFPTESEECLPKNNDQFLKARHSIKNQSLSSEGDRIHLEGELNEYSCQQSVFAGCASPVKQWKSKLTSSEIEKSQSSSMFPRDIKENTLEEKLLEARMEGRKSRSKAS
ncbi:Plasma membrane-like protein isoform 1 [Tripterygium wilfordii]|uniref:Plasma membrane-like protein isoform 1 n=1 Tax=Tripterygium wilfordii TaxID=458696 RepID=A0A7J7CGD4_TRIWF|nr:uncharacterized protein At5g41620-like [Tripterygium wilfordii]KAF5733099.1 Plasma membrane-like protein isoform 1 [Tripterygium wilfordii]